MAALDSLNLHVPKKPIFGFLEPNGDRPRIMHTGGGPGFAVIMQAYPAERLGIVLLGNEFAYGAALPFSGTVPRDAIAHLAASLDW